MNPESEISELLPMIYKREHCYWAVWGARGICGQGEGTGHSSPTKAYGVRDVI